MSVQRKGGSRSSSGGPKRQPDGPPLERAATAASSTSRLASAPTTSSTARAAWNVHVPIRRGVESTPVVPAASARDRRAPAASVTRAVPDSASGRAAVASSEEGPRGRRSPAGPAAGPVADDLREARRGLATAARALERIESMTGPVEPADPYAAAGQVFVDEIRVLLGDRPPDLEAVRRGALLAVAEQAWSERLGNLLDTQDVVKILGVTKQRISTLVSEHRVVALHVRGRVRFPAWQFTLPAAPDRECLASAHEMLVRIGSISPWSAASWFQGAHGELDGVDPVTYLKNGGDRAHLLRVAQRDATRLSR